MSQTFRHTGPAIKIARPRNALKAALCGAAFLYAFASLPAHANPEGGVVSGGAADLSYNGNHLDVHQHTERAVIDWRSFNIGASEHTQFHQPSSSAVILNRINDVNPSRIDGRLSANGHVVLVNPNGIVFGATSRVDVGSLTATTADITNDDFMAGRMNFDRPGSPDGEIRNEGHITAREAGLVNLVAPRVENSGIIEAKLGKVTLASADTMTIDMAGDGLVKVAVSREQLQGHVKNSGQIIADGGRVHMTAAAARDIVDTLIVNTGTIRARTGSVHIHAEGANKSGKTGSSRVINSGTIDVSGTANPSDKGGTVKIAADEITLESTSRIHADGNAGGGTIHIGGEYQGGGDMPTAKNVQVKSGAITTANAIQQGNGGEVIFWADNAMDYHGHIESKGGAQDGNGGFAEVSGHKWLNFKGTADLSAAHGEYGTLLLDPTDIEITDVDSNVTGPNTFQPDGDDVVSKLSAATLKAALENANVRVQTRAGGTMDGNITISSALNWVSSRTLTLDAHNDIVVNAALTGRTITFIAGGDVNINAKISTNTANQGNVIFYNKNPNSSIGIGDGQMGTIQLSNADLNNIQDGFSSIAFGNANTNLINVGAYSWKSNVGFTTSNSGAINIVGSQNLNSKKFGVSTGTFTVNSGASVIGIAGTNILNADRFNIYGEISSNSLLGFHFLSDQAQSPIIEANITASTISFLPKGTSQTLNIGVGDNASGDVIISDAALSHLKAGGINFGGTMGAWEGNLWQNVDVQERNWTINRPAGQSLGFGANGIVTFSGNQNLGAGHLTLFVNSAPVLPSSIISTGNFLLATGNIGGTTAIGIGSSATGDFVFKDEDINKLNDSGFATLSFGGAYDRDVHISYADWKKNLQITTGNTGSITVSPLLNTNNYSLTVKSPSITFGAGIIRGSSSVTIDTNTLTINGPVTGTANSGELFLRSFASADMGVGDYSGGTAHFSTNLVNSLLGSGFSKVNIGDRSQAINITEMNWQVPTLRLRSNDLTISGAQNFQDSSVQFDVVRINLNDKITGSGTLTFSVVAPHLGLGSGTSGQTFHLDDTELANIGNEFSAIIINPWTGYNSPITINSLAPWRFDAAIQASHADGKIIIEGNQNFGSHSIIFKANDISINGAVNGTGTLTFDAISHNVGIGIGDGALGKLKFSAAELNRIGNGLSQVIYGGTTNNTIDLRAHTWNHAPTFMTTSAGTINVNGAQDFGAHNVTFITNNLNLNSTLAGTKTALFDTVTNNVGIGVGTGAAGALQFTNDELGRILITNASFGTRASNNNIIINHYNWAYNTSFETSQTRSITLNGAQINDRNMAFTSGVLTINGNVTHGSGILRVAADTITIPGTISATPTRQGTLHLSSYAGKIAIGDGADSAAPSQYSTSLLNQFMDANYSVIRFFGGRTATITAMDWRADRVEFQLGNPVFAGTQNFGAADVNILSTTPNITAPFVGTGNLSFYGWSTTQTMGVGSGTTGDIHLSDSALAQISNDFSSVVFGGVGGNGNRQITVNRLTEWSFSPTFKNSSTGSTTITGVQNFGAYDVIFETNNLNLNAPITGTGKLSFNTNSHNAGIGLGNGATGALNLDSAELANISNNFSQITYGSDTIKNNIIDLRAHTWNHAPTFMTTASGAINVNGAQDFNVYNATFLTNNLNVNNTITSQKTLVFGTATLNVGIGVGDGAAGALQFTNEELNRISALNVDFGILNNKNNIVVNNHSWDFNARFYNSTTSSIILNGAQMNDRNLLFYTGALTINGNVTHGSGTLTINANNITVPGQIVSSPIRQGTLNLSSYSGRLSIGDGADASAPSQYSTAVLDKFMDGNFSIIRFNGGRSATIAAMDWRADRIEFQLNTPVFTGVQNFGTADVKVWSINPEINAPFVGTGNLQFYGSSTSHTLGIGSGTTGDIHLSDDELSNISNTFSSVVFGGTGSNGNRQITVNRLTEWNFAPTFANIATGSTTITGAQNFGIYDVFFESDNLNLNAAITGTGKLHFNTITNNAGIGLGDGAAGALNLNSTELSNISNSFSEIIYGSNTGHVNIIDLRAHTWNHAPIFLTTTSGTINVNGAQNFGAHNAIFKSNNINILDNLSGTGILSLEAATDARDMFIGTDGGTGMWSMSDASLSRIGTTGNMFSRVVFGNAARKTRDVIIDSWDLSDKSYDVEIYGNGITIQNTDATANYAIKLGVGNFMAHAVERDPSTGNLTVTANITSSQPSTSRLDLRADNNITIASSALTIAAADNADKLHIILNADRNDDGKGEVFLENVTINTLGGDFIIGGGATPLMGAVTGTSDHGIHIKNSIINVGDGHANLRGKGESTGADNYGVFLEGSRINSTSGNIDLYGDGGNGHNNNYGIYLNNSFAQSESGDITLTGTGSNATGSNNPGIYLYTARIINQSGNIVLNGTSSTSGNSRGIQTDLSSQISTTSGNITLAGLSHGNNRGIHLGNNNTKVNSVDGNIYIKGTSLGNGDGILIGGVRIESTGSSKITIEAISGSGTDLRFSGAGSINGEVGLITILANEWHTSTSGAALIASSTFGNILIKSRDSESDIFVGTTGAGLSLDDATLEKISAGGTLIIGDANSGTGAVTVNNWNIGSSANHVALHGGDLIINGLTGNNVNLHARGLIDVNNDITLGGALVMNAQDDIRIADADITAQNITANAAITYDGTTAQTRTINAGAGILTLTNVNAGARNLVLVADDMALGGTIATEDNHALDIRPFTDNRGITLGGAGGLSLDQAEIARLQSSGLLTIGKQNVGTGALNVHNIAFTSNVALFGGHAILNGLSSTGTILVRSQGAGNDITLNGAVSSLAAGDAITLVSADDFFNHAGAEALQASDDNGRWLVYSERMDHNMRGGLMPDASEFNVTYADGPAGSGNRLLYSTNIRPTLTITIDDAELLYNQEYDLDSTTYTITGPFIDGDDINNIGLSGAPIFGTTYQKSVTTASNTPYAGMLTGDIGTLESRIGYLFDPVVVAGALLVNPLPVPPSLPSKEPETVIDTPAPVPASHTPSVRNIPAPYMIAATAPPVFMQNTGSSRADATSVITFGKAGETSGASPTATEGAQTSSATPIRASLVLSEGFSFSTQGLSLFISPEIRGAFGLPDSF